MNTKKNMITHNLFGRTSRSLKVVSGIVAFVTLIVGVDTVHAVSSWSPTLLVNTESFQTIDSGDGTTDIELRFGTTTQTIKFLTSGKFEFSRGVKVQGNLSGSSLTVDKNATIGGSLTASGSIRTKLHISGSTLHVDKQVVIGGPLFVTGSTVHVGNTTVKAVLSGATLRVTGNADVHGALTVTGAIRTDNNITLNDDADSNNVLLTFGSDTTNETITWFNTADRFQISDDLSVVGSISGSSLRIDGGAEIHGPLTASGAFRTDSNITLNDDSDSNDVLLTFGSNGTNETITWFNTADRFQISDDLSVVGHISGSSLNVDRNATVGGTLTATGSIRTKGNLSGSTLTVDGSTNIHGVTYNWSATQGASNSYLKNDGSGNLSWVTSTVGAGSGGILSFHPEYPNAIYFASGASAVGQMTLSGGTTALDNTYLWSSSRSSIQDYWISVRVRLPDNFSSWDVMRPIQMRVKTGTNNPAQNHITVRMRDTNGALVALSSGAMVNPNFGTVDLKGPETTGTWDPKGYFTVYVKLASSNAASAYAGAGFINFRFETNTP